MKQKNVLSEITPLTSENCFILMNRTKEKFNYPSHIHKEYELNLVIGAKGAQRIVGDSIEEIEDLDLTLIANPYLEHTWVNHRCESKSIHEITIQFHPTLFSEDLLKRTQFKTIFQLLRSAQKGVSFSHSTIEQILPQINTLCETKGFYAVLGLFSILYELSLATNIKILSSISCTQNKDNDDSLRINKVTEYLYQNYDKDISLKDVAGLVNLCENAFCRYFRKRTGYSFVEYLTNIRIGMATKLLIDTNKPIIEICYQCGFNNLSNFNRSFRKKKQCSPTEFRQHFAKARQII